MAFAKGMSWVEANVKEELVRGKIVVITGANSGIGLEAARVLGGKGAKVVMACRNETKAKAAMEDLVNGVSEYGPKYPHPIKVPKENLEFVKLDLSDLVSVESAAKEIAEKYPKLDILINNAGVMAPSKRESTAQGFELQLGTNVFGHYALTALLAPTIVEAKTRVVWVSSGAHKTVSTIDFSDIDKLKSYSKWRVYGESKLGNMLLMRKFAEIFPSSVVLACHPGYSATNLQNNTEFEKLNYVLAQSGFMGGLPTVMAAIDPTLKSGDYIGPYWSAWGVPSHAGATGSTRKKELIEKLFDVCQEKTKISPKL